MKYFLTRSTEYLSKTLKKNKIKIEKIEYANFADGEKSYRLIDELDDGDVILIGSVTPNPESLFELLAIADLLKTNGPKNLKLVIPYLGYARQDRPAQKGEGSTGIMVAKIIKSLEPTAIEVLEPHSPLIFQALGKQAKFIDAVPLFVKALIKTPIDIIIAPDKGAVERATRLVKQLESKIETGFIEKFRPQPNVAVARLLHGDVRGKNVLIFDDMIDTGGTIIQAVKLLKKHGAKQISLAATHGIFSKNARDRLIHLPIKEIFVTNSLPQTKHNKIKILDITPFIIEQLN